VRSLDITPIRVLKGAFDPVQVAKNVAEHSAIRHPPPPVHHSGDAIHGDGSDARGVGEQRYEVCDRKVLAHVDQGVLSADPGQLPTSAIQPPETVTSDRDSGRSAGLSPFAHPNVDLVDLAIHPGKPQRREAADGGAFPGHQKGTPSALPNPGLRRVGVIDPR